MEIKRDKYLIDKHANTALYVRTRMENGPLTAHEVLNGVSVSFEDYLRLVQLAARSIENPKTSQRNM